MKIVMIANIIIESVFMICVSILAIKFQNTSLLWWFVLIPFLGFSYKIKPNKEKENQNG